jgi:hypothetical protein
MLLDEKGVIIVIPKDPVYQSVRTLKYLIQRAISNYNYEKFSTPSYVPCFFMRMVSSLSIRKTRCIKLSNGVTSDKLFDPQSIYEVQRGTNAHDAIQPTPRFREQVFARGKQNQQSAQLTLLRGGNQRPIQVPLPCSRDCDSLVCLLVI